MWCQVFNNFALVINVVSEEDRLNTLLEMLFVNGLVIVTKMKEELQKRVAVWQEYQQRNGMKSKHLEVMLSRSKKLDITVKGNETLYQIVQFKYIGCKLAINARIIAT